MERVLEIGSKEREKLQIVASLLNLLCNETYFTVEDTWWDVGANIAWTTIIGKNERSSWQILYPKQWHEICDAESIVELYDIAKGLKREQESIK